MLQRNVQNCSREKTCTHPSDGLHGHGMFLEWGNTDKKYFLTFPVGFSVPNIFPILIQNCSNVLDLKNLPEHVIKAFCFRNCKY